MKADKGRKENWGWLHFRAEAARHELEGKEKGLRKEAGQQMRELESGRGEALKQLQEAQAAAQSREHALQVNTPRNALCVTTSSKADNNEMQDR